MRKAYFLIGIVFLTMFTLMFTEVHAFPYQNTIQEFNISFLSNVIIGASFNGSHIATLEGNSQRIRLYNVSDFSVSTSCSFAGLAFPPLFEMIGNNSFVFSQGNADTLNRFIFDNANCSFQNDSNPFGSQFFQKKGGVRNITAKSSILNLTNNSNAQFYGNNFLTLSIFNNSQIINSTSGFPNNVFNGVSNNFAYFSRFSFFGNASGSFKLQEVLIHNVTNANLIKSINVTQTYNISLPSGNENFFVLSYGNHTTTQKLAWLIFKDMNLGSGSALLVDLQIGFTNLTIQAIFPANNETITQDFVSLQARVNSAKNGTVLFFLNDTNIGNVSYSQSEINTIVDKFFSSGLLEDGNYSWFAQFITFDNETFTSNTNFFTVSTGLAETVGNIMGDVFGVSNEAGLNLFALFLAIAISLSAGFGFAFIGDAKGVLPTFLILFVSIIFVELFIGWINIVIGLIIIIVTVLSIAKLFSDVFFGS